MGLELGMGDGGLQDHGEVVAVDEGDQVGEQLVQILLGRWDELRAGRAEGAAPHPVLLFAHCAAEMLVTCAVKERAVHAQQVVERDLPRLRSDGDGLLHCPDVADDLERGVVAADAGSGARQAPLAHHEPLDAAGAHRLLA